MSCFYNFIPHKISSKNIIYRKEKCNRSCLIIFISVDNVFLIDTYLLESKVTLTSAADSITGKSVTNQTYFYLY